MGGGGSRAPKPDPLIGQSALLTAQTGANYLDWMKDRAEITDAWAQEDRARSEKVFQPMQDQFIRDAKAWDSPGRQATAARTAAADVSSSIALQQAQDDRELAAMGVNPASGRGVQARRRLGIERGLAIAGAKNMARAGVRKEGMALRGDAINMGSGLAVNPLSSFTAGTSAGARGFEGAQQGYAQQGQLLNQQYGSQLQAWQAEQDQGNPLMNALGMGAGLLFASDENIKEGRRPARGILKALKKTPIDTYRYKPDEPAGDGGAVRHIGPMAQDFQKATGTGDGKTIAVQDALGTALGAIKELDAKVDKIAAARRPRGVRASLEKRAA